MVQGRKQEDSEKDTGREQEADGRGLPTYTPGACTRLVLPHSSLCVFLSPLLGNTQPHWPGTQDGVSASLGLAISFIHWDS